MLSKNFRNLEGNFSIVSLRLILVFLVIYLTVNTAHGKPVTEADIVIVAKNWVLQNDGNHFGEKIGKEIAQIVRYEKSTEGEVDYYLITFAPNGWLIVPADDDFGLSNLSGADICVLNFSKKQYGMK